MSRRKAGISVDVLWKSWSVIKYKYKRRCGLKTEPLNLRFGLEQRASFGDVGFLLLSTSAFPKSVSVQEAQQMSLSVW